MIILASASPARAKLLTDWGYTFTIFPTHIDELKYQQTITDPKQLVETLATQKVAACHSSPQYTIIAADTVIYFNNQIIGKPINRDHAQHIIRLLSGQTHQVWTGVCINQQVFSDMAEVTFRPMTKTQIESYLDTNDWVGKAGAYQIQKAIHPFVAKIDRDINTIIGLPITIKNILNSGSKL